MELKHPGILCNKGTKGGRRLKARRLGKDINGAITQVYNSKMALPLPRDVMKSSAFHNQQAITYNYAWRKLNTHAGRNKKQLMQAFQLIIPFLKNFKTANEGSVVEYEKEENSNKLRRVFICPGFMDNILKFVRPVISCDAAHMKSEQKGMIYMFSTLSAKHEIFIIAFGLASGNEDYSNWKWMTEHFLKACPIIKSKNVNSGTTTDQSNQYNEIVFVSDCNKGLGKTLHELLPKNLSTHCAFHLRQNLLQKFGMGCASHVMAVGRSYPTQQEEYHPDKLKKLEDEKAFEYLEKLKIDNGKAPNGY